MIRHCQALLVDDHPMLRRGLCQLLQLDPRFATPLQAGSGPEALALMTQHAVDLVVLDLNMQPMSGLDTLQAIRRQDRTCKVVIYSVSDAPRDAEAVMAAGADGFLIKDTDPDELIEALAAITQGQQRLSPSLTQALQDEHRWDRELTPRERQIADLIAQGMSNKAISEALFISEGTAKVHVKNLLRKTGCSSRVALAVKALEQ
ncbi:response regulator [Ferrimonas pelagia]|uniref:Response regulator n=2 Tax=Ferrimonas pelagia TaxID=1177826 RepID=A0ABP9EQ99_9GAMM